jgi:hypothetical protein
MENGRPGKTRRWLIRGVLILLVCFPFPASDPFAGEESKGDWQREWERTVRAAEEEGQVVLYSLSEVGEVFLHSGFQKRFPKIKLVSVTARGVDHPDLGPEFLKRLYGEMDLTLYRQFPQGEDWLASGKFLLCLCRHQSISEAKTQGLPVDLVDPMRFKEGVGIETRAKTLALMNKAPHPNAAKVFINWFLSREGQIDFQKISTKYIDAGGEGSLRMDVPRDDIPLRNQLVPGVQYIPQWAPEMFDMKPIEKAVEEGLNQAGRK